MTRLPEPERWTDRPRGSVSAEDLLGAALRGARAATVPSEALLARVDAGLVPAVALDLTVGRWRVAMTALVALLAVGGTVGAARGPLRVWATRHGLLAARASAPSARAPSHVARVVASTPGVPAAPLDVARPSDAPALVAPVVVASAPQPSGVAAMRPRAPGRPRVEPDVVAAPPAVEEARILERVFHELRAGAPVQDEVLAALDDYDRRFPSGLLRAEARLARAEALLVAGRRAEALALLDAWDGPASGLPRGARVARGELRADAGRCAEAADDFDAALATSSDDELGGRALYGRASCALASGQHAAAAAALTRYLDGHADGAHAAEARDALARLRARTPPP